MQNLTLTTVAVGLPVTVAVAVDVAVVVEVSVGCAGAVVIESAADDNSAIGKSCGWESTLAMLGKFNPKLSGRTALGEEDSRWVSLP